MLIAHPVIPSTPPASHSRERSSEANVRTGWRNTIAGAAAEPACWIR